MTVVNVWVYFIFLASLCICFVLFLSNILSEELEFHSWRDCESNTTWEHLLKLGSIMFFCFQSKIKLYEERLRGLSYSNRQIWKVDPWALCLFAVFVLRRGRSAERLFNSGLVHWDHVCCGAAHPRCSHGLLCAEKQKWQVCRYAAAAAAPATRHVLHGKRSVSLWPGLGPLVVSLQMNQNSTFHFNNEMHSTWYRRHQSYLVISDLIIFQYLNITNFSAWRFNSTFEFGWRTERMKMCNGPQPWPQTFMEMHYACLLETAC